MIGTKSDLATTNIYESKTSMLLPAIKQPTKMGGGWICAKNNPN